jgi:hypothetical protein
MPYAWRSLAAFLVSGILMSFLGAILPAWGYHLRSGFKEVGAYFLELGSGIAAVGGRGAFPAATPGFEVPIS